MKTSSLKSKLQTNSTKPSKAVVNIKHRFISEFLCWKHHKLCRHATALDHFVEAEVCFVVQLLSSTY